MLRHSVSALIYLSLEMKGAVTWNTNKPLVTNSCLNGKIQSCKFLKPVMLISIPRICTLHLFVRQKIHFVCAELKINLPKCVTGVQRVENMLNQRSNHMLIFKGENFVRQLKICWSFTWNVCTIVTQLGFNETVPPIIITHVVFEN